MPVNREPHIYQGYVISQIGQQLGQEVYMDFKNAQNCVMAGTHRWADDPTDMSNVVRMQIADNDAALAAQVEADRLHNEKLKREAEEAAEAQAAAALAARYANIKSIEIRKIEGQGIFLTRPWPDETSFTAEVVEDSPPGMVTEVWIGEGDGAENFLDIKFANAEARYKVTGYDEENGIFYAELLSASSPDVDIPANWRELSHLQLIPLAKKITGQDGSMKKAEAVEILEAWTKVDDQVRTEEPAQATEGQEGGQQENRDLGFRDKSGNPTTPEARAQEAALEDFGDD